MTMIAALVFAALAGAPGAGPAFALPEAVGVDALSGTPQEVAGRFLGPAAGPFREMDLVVPHPSPDIRAVVLFKAPAAASAGTCSVEVVTVDVDFDVPRAPAAGPLVKPRRVRTERRYKLLPEATDDRCGGLRTAKDFFTVDAEDAVPRGAEPFRQAILAARSAAPLPFEMGCQDYPGGRSGACAKKGRKALAGMDPGKIGRVGPCAERPASGACYTITYDPPAMMNGQEGWSVDVISTEPGKARTIRLRHFFYPVS